MCKVLYCSLRSQPLTWRVCIVEHRKCIGFRVFVVFSSFIGVYKVFRVLSLLKV